MARSRCLRTAHHVAHRDYTCDWCQNPIEPGSLYERHVFVCEGDGLHERFRHIYPGCNFFDGPWKYMRDFEEADGYHDSELPLAA
jgi:hypothetical protein